MIRPATIVLFVMAAGVAAESGKVSFCAAGDVMLARDVAARMQKEGIGVPFGGLAPVLKTRDLAFCNFECTVTNRGARTYKQFNFRCPPESALGIVGSGFNVVSLANNHSYDYGPEALKDTRAFFQDNGLWCSGAGANAWDALSPARIEKNGLRIALFSFMSFRPPGYYNKRPRNPQPAIADSQTIRSVVPRAHRDADVVIVSFHWGREYQHYPWALQKKYGRLCIDAGADLVIGHHPHAIQTIERYKGKLILYSLGNCIMDQYTQQTTEGLLFCCTLTKQGVAAPYLIPLVLRNCRPEPAHGEDLYRIEAKLRRYCARSKIRILEDAPILALR